jgi:hypothetical protein
VARFSEAEKALIWDWWQQGGSMRGVARELGGHAMTEPKTHRTRSGRTPTDEEIDALATEVIETDYDVGVLKTRRQGRPSMCSGPADEPRASTSVVSSRVYRAFRIWKVAERDFLSRQPQISVCVGR